MGSQSFLYTKTLPVSTAEPLPLAAMGVALGVGELIPDVERFMAELPGKTLELIRGVCRGEGRAVGPRTTIALINTAHLLEQAYAAEG
jgi:hypothetical protein